MGYTQAGMRDPQTRAVGVNSMLGGLAQPEFGPSHGLNPNGIAYLHPMSMLLLRPSNFPHRKCILVLSNRSVIRSEYLLRVANLGEEHFQGGEEGKRTRMPRGDAGERGLLHVREEAGPRKEMQSHSQSSRVHDI